MTLRNFCFVMAILAATCASAQAQQQDPALRERVNRVGSDLFSPAPHPADAIKELKAILAVAPDLPEAHLLLGVAYRAQGSPDLMGEAVAELRQALALNPELTQARMILARIAPGASNILYKNNRNGTFSNVTVQSATAGTSTKVYKTGVAVGDYDKEPIANR